MKGQSAAGCGLVVAIAVALVSSCGGGSHEGNAFDVGLIAQRVERIRGLRFDHVPKVRLLRRSEFEDEATKLAGESAGDRTDLAQVKRQLATARQFIFQTGLLTPNEIGEATSGGSDEAGLYSLRTNELLVLDAGSRKSREATIAHELTHALEDQTFGSRIATQLSPLSDRGSAYRALLEGSATVVELLYGKRYLDTPGTVQDRLARLDRNATRGGLPRPLAAEAVFPYAQGARFVLALERRAGGWRLVDRAHDHPPTTTSSILHPSRFVHGQRPAHPQIGSSPLGDGWTRVGSLELGELDTAVLLRSGLPASTARTVAAGWAGGAVVAFRHGSTNGCRAPCRRRVALHAAWSWRSKRAAAAFDEAIPRWFARTLHGRPTGGGTWRLDRGAAAVSTRGRESHLAFAPTPASARALAGG